MSLSDKKFMDSTGLSTLWTKIKDTFITESDLITAVNIIDAAKQDKLPNVTNNRYLHTNETTGALEWCEVDASGGGSKIYYQAEEPTSAVEGDIWIDTDDESVFDDVYTKSETYAKSEIDSIVGGLTASDVGAVSATANQTVTGTKTFATAKVSAGTDYTTAKLRNVILSTANPTASDGQNGDIWIKYTN